MIIICVAIICLVLLVLTIGSLICDSINHKSFLDGLDDDDDIFTIIISCLFFLVYIVHCIIYIYNTYKWWGFIGISHMLNNDPLICFSGNFEHELKPPSYKLMLFILLPNIYKWILILRCWYKKTINMKRLLFIFLVCLLMPVFGSKASNGNTTVYICTSQRVYAYHLSRYCSGLNRCSETIKEVTLDEAIRLKKQPCKRCAQ